MKWIEDNYYDLATIIDNLCKQSSLYWQPKLDVEELKQELWLKICDVYNKNPAKFNRAYCIKVCQNYITDFQKRERKEQKITDKTLTPQMIDEYYQGSNSLLANESENKLPLVVEILCVSEFLQANGKESENKILTALLDASGITECYPPVTHKEPCESESEGVLIAKTAGYSKAGTNYCNAKKRVATKLKLFMRSDTFAKHQTDSSKHSPNF